MLTLKYIYLAWFCTTILFYFFYVYNFTLAKLCSAYVCLCFSFLFFFYDEADDLHFVVHNTNNCSVFTLSMFIFFKKKMPVNFCKKLCPSMSVEGALRS